MHPPRTPAPIAAAQLCCSSASRGGFAESPASPDISCIRSLVLRIAINRIATSTREQAKLRYHRVSLTKAKIKGPPRLRLWGAGTHGALRHVLWRGGRRSGPALGHCRLDHGARIRSGRPVSFRLPSSRQVPKPSSPSEVFFRPHVLRRMRVCDRVCRRSYCRRGTGRARRRALPHSPPWRDRVHCPPALFSLCALLREHGSTLSTGGREGGADCGSGYGFTG